jgi:hypothetical protein
VLCNALFDKLKQAQSESLKCGIFHVIGEDIRRLVFPLQVLVSFETWSLLRPWPHKTGSFTVSDTSTRAYSHRSMKIDHVFLPKYMVFDVFVCAINLLMILVLLQDIPGSSNAF